MKKILAMFFVAATFMLASCKKDPQPTPQPDPQPQDQSAMLANTSWTCEMEGTYYYSGIEMFLNLVSTLDFFENKEGELFLDLNVTVPSMPSIPDQNQNITANFTYTFDGTNIVMTETEIDEETGEPVTYVYNGVYNSVDETITIDFDDEEMASMMGTDLMVFTKL